MEHDIDWSKSHNGVMLCDFNQAVVFMPEADPILSELYNSDMLELPVNEYAVDIKVHMLMPKMWPCIPNWHRDFVPRDDSNKRLPKELPAVEDCLKMYEWISGPPFTEFMRQDKSTYLIKPQEWHSFTQHDVHRGTRSDKFQWRCFIRVIPKSFIHPATINIGTKRQHIQTYLEAPDKFNW